MSATNLQANWTAVTFPTNATTLNKIDDVSFRLGGGTEKYAGDLDRFNTLAVALMTEPGATIQTSNPAQVMGILPGTSGTLTATHSDAKLATGGAIVYTLSNAIFEDAQTNGPHGSLGKATATFSAISSDGVTSPLAFTRS